MKAMIVIGLCVFSGQAAAAQNECRLDAPVGMFPGLVDFLGNELIDWAEENEDPASVETENLPSGAMSAEQLVQIVLEWKEESPSLLEVFQRVSDGQKHTISGDAVRDATQLAGLILPNFVPADALQEIVIENGQVWVRLDGDQEIDVPSVDTWVLEPQEDGSDPYAVVAQNQPYQHASTSYTLKINEDLLFDFDENGLHGIR